MTTPSTIPEELGPRDLRRLIAKQGTPNAFRWPNEKNDRQILAIVLEKKSMCPGYGGRAIWEKIGADILSTLYLEDNYLRGQRFDIVPFFKDLAEWGFTMDDLLTQLKPNASRSDQEWFQAAIAFDRSQNPG